MDNPNVEVIRHATALEFAYPDFSKLILVATDASCAVVKAVLRRLDNNGKEYSDLPCNYKFEKSKK